VWDLAAAHVAAVAGFDDALGQASSIAINLGTGTGTTVRELVAAFNSVVERPVEVVEAARRPGDVAGAFTRSDRAKRLLNWQPRYSIADGITDSMRWAAVRSAVLGES
jgi:UDP-glucose 4-epimerase